LPDVRDWAPASLESEDIMKKTMLIAVMVVCTASLILADFAAAQCGGCCKSGGCKGGRSNAAVDRVTPSWTTPAKASTGESKATADGFESIKEIQDAAKKGWLTLLYIYSSADGSKVLKFENALFRDEKLAVAIKPFRCLKMDVAENAAAQSMFGKKAPRFIAFNDKGKRSGQVVLSGYKTATGALLKILVKAAKGHGKVPLMSFVKKYRSFLNDLDQLESKKKILADKKARLVDSSSKGKKKKLQEAEAGIARMEKALLDAEKKLLESVKAYGTEIRASKPAAAVGADNK